MTEPYRTADAAPAGAHEGERERPDGELERLARVGAERRNDVETAARVERQRDGQRHLQIAIGAYRGSAMKRTAVAIAVAAGLVASASVLLTAPVLAVAVVAIAVTVVIVAAVAVPPLASPATIAAEERWVTSLPFRLEGYFEVLSRTPAPTRTVVYDVWWAAGHGPDTTFLENVVAAVDPAARVERRDAEGARIVSGPISGITSVKQSSRSYVSRNHKIPPSVHALVERVLVALHRRYPLARVSVTSR